MNESPESELNPLGAEDEAAAWVWRLDRGLSATEQDAFFDWLAADPRHAALLKQQRSDWKRLDQLSAWRPEHSSRPNPDLLAPKPKVRMHRFVWGAIAAAAAIAFGLLVFQKSVAPTTTPVSSAIAEAKPEIRNLLDDGSTIKLKAGAEVKVLYSPRERRVRLEQGEAFFMVAKDPSRPFVVEVEGVDVSAIGTAFNVRLDGEAVEVLVAEGIVQVGSPSVRGTPPELRKEPRLVARERAIIPLDSRESAPQIAVLSRAEIQRVLAWQHGMMTFSEKPLSDIIEELNRINDTQLTIVDPSLARERFSGTFLSSNVEGFVSVLRNGYGVVATPQGGSEILLSKVVD